MQNLETQSKRSSLLPRPHTNTEQTPYPVQALPAVVRQAVIAYQQYGQQPLSLVACSALASVSLACQAMANVARDSYLISPVSIYCLIIAQSGERKSAADYTFSKAIRQWQTETRQRLGIEMQAVRTAQQAWQMEKEGLLKEISRQSINNEAEFLRERLIELMAEEPEMPLLPMLFFEDATQEAIASHLAHGWPSASLATDEGGTIIGSHGMHHNMSQFIALLNRLWDGKNFTVHRKVSKSFTITDRRLTVNLMMQPMLLGQLLAKQGGLSRQSGFIARSLIAFPRSAMGGRYYQEPVASLASLSAFEERITDCLDSSLNLDKQGCRDLPTLALSKPAKACWVSFFNSIEAGLASELQWQSIPDVASKMADNTARLAGLFHLFTGAASSVISKETIEQAIEISRWHLYEAKNLFAQKALSPSQQDAEKLLQWLLEKGTNPVSPRYVLQYSPLRDKSRRDAALAHLIELNYVQSVQNGDKTLLYLNSFEPHPR